MMGSTRSRTEDHVNPPDQGVEVDDTIADAFVIASRALVGLAIRSINAAPVEVTLPQHRLMVLLAARSSRTIGDLAEQLGIDQSNASRLTDRLEKLGLIARERSTSDRRAVDVSLTTVGEELLETVHTHRRQEVKRVLAHMSPRQLNAMVRALNSFSTAAEENTDKNWSAYAL